MKIQKLELQDFMIFHKKQDAIDLTAYRGGRILANFCKKWILVEAPFGQPNRIDM